jgi:hypothetical protein
MEIDEIIALFNKEFVCLKHKFVTIKLLEGGKRSMDYNTIHHLQLPEDNPQYIWKPGVYVFYANKRVYRIGRHLENSRLRVMQHIKADTGNEEHRVSDLIRYDDQEILLFNVKTLEDCHWVAALEIFLEDRLNPLIPSKRRG